MRIAVDAMGGDDAPQTPVAGAVLAARKLGAEVVLVGLEDAIRSALSHYPAAPKISVVAAPDVIGMDESPTSALRRKRHSSIHEAARLLRDGKVDGLVSAGNTGAVMVTVKTLVGTLSGVDRPALAVTLPNVDGRTVLLDVGANVDPKSEQLVQFAVMGSFLARDILGIANPRVGLLSIGEEAGKGNELIRHAHKQLQQAPLHFLGNVEARDIYNGSADVVVCDGFTGNVVLKTSEATAETLQRMAREELGRKLLGRIGGLLARSSFRRLRKRADWAEFGGAPLLGVRGLCVICHGRSSPRALMHGVRVALEYREHRVSERIEAALASLQDARARSSAAGTDASAAAPDLELPATAPNPGEHLQEKA